MKYTSTYIIMHSNANQPKTINPVYAEIIKTLTANWFVLLKKIHCVFIVIILFHANILAQTETKTVKKLPEGEKLNAVNEHNIIIEPYYGYPYWWGYILKMAFDNDTLYNNVNVRNRNHIGAKVEYMVSPKIGIGLDVSYGNVIIHYSKTYGNTGNYKGGISKLRVLGRMNFHFGSSPVFDPYATVGFGYRNTHVYDNDPNASVKNESITLVPISFRMGVGCRYFFSDTFGMHAEMGLGGPVVLGGINVKL